MNIIKIGITGSFGKTSCKRILLHILNNCGKKAIATESNYNTPMGIAMTVERIKDEQFFIAEMGARHIGDIAALCTFVRPEYGIITGVGEQHLATFGNVDNIYKEKKKLADWLVKDGVCVFNGNDKYGLTMYKEHNGEKMKVCINKVGDIFAKNIEFGSFGSRFDIVFNATEYPCETKLLGKNNITNILLCVALATKIGINIDDAIKSVASLEQIEHRLQLIENNGIKIIDDSYNANVRGIECALECLSKFKGRKIVFSQGIVEAGGRQADQNRYIGRLIAVVADVVLVTGMNAKAIEEGLENNGYNGQIKYYRNFFDAQKDFKNILRTGDVLLIQNDIPDTM